MSRGNEGNEERTEPYRRYAGCMVVTDEEAEEAGKG